MTTSRYEHSFDPDKPNNTASSIFRLAAEEGGRVLDLGSGPGIVAGALATRLHKHVTCVDLLEEHLEAASERGVSRTIQGDLAEDAWAAELTGEQFDVIILADVLEHLVDPTALIRRIREHKLLAEDGALVISIPNASHIAILASLAAGDFPYRPTGLLDETHLRFFTLTSLRRLLEGEGYTPTRVLRTVRRLEETELRSLGRQVDPEVVAGLYRQHGETDTYQFVLRAQPLAVAPGPLQEELEKTRSQHARARKRAKSFEKQVGELEAHITELEEHKAALEKERATFEEQWTRGEQRRQKLKGRTSRLKQERAQLKERITELETRTAQLEARLEAVYSSRTWRMGRVFTAAPGALRRRR